MKSNQIYYFQCRLIRILCPIIKKRATSITDVITFHFGLYNVTINIFSNNGICHAFVWPVRLPELVKTYHRSWPIFVFYRKMNHVILSDNRWVYWRHLEVRSFLVDCMYKQLSFLINVFCRLIAFASLWSSLHHH